jgi:hypothetical protein
MLRKESSGGATGMETAVAHRLDLGTVEEGEDTSGKNRVWRHGYTVPRM